MTAQKKKSSNASIDPAGLVETAFLMGLGALEITREKVGELTEELVDRGKMSKSEARRVGDHLGTLAKDQQAAMRTTVAKETDRAMKASGVASHKDVEALKKEIAELKAMIAQGNVDAPKKAAATKPKSTATRAKASAKPKTAPKATQS